MGPILAKKSLEEGPISQKLRKKCKIRHFCGRKTLRNEFRFAKILGKKRKNQPFLREKNEYGFQNSGPTPRQKIIWVRATSMGTKISLLVIWMTAYKKPNLVYKWVDFSKVPQTWAKIGLALRKFWKNCVILLKILPKIKQIGTLMGQYFLKTWHLLGTFIGLLSKSAQHIPTKN